MNRRTLARMKVRLASLLAGTGATLIGGNAMAHPGHAATDFTAQLSAPLAGADHVTVFAVVSVLVALGAGRLALFVIERRQRTMARLRRKR
jgi:hydrogenase/urease accessory protein HupE